MGRSERIVEAGRFADPAAENVLITSRSGALDRDRAAAADVGSRLGGLPEVARVAPPVPSPDGAAVLVRADMTGDAETAADRVQPLVDALPAVLAALGRWVDRPRVPLLHRLTMRPGHESRLWSALLRPTLQRPAR